MSAIMRYAWRRLRRTPAFTAVAVLTLALGIAATTTFFSLVDTVAYRPVGIAALDRILVVKILDRSKPVNPRDPLGLLSATSIRLTFEDLHALERRTPDGVMAVTGVGDRYSQIVQIPGRAEYDVVERVTGGYARVFDAHTVAGRWISDEDNASDAGARIAVIGERLWREWFHADPAIVDHATVKIARESYTVVGVAPPDFHGVTLTTDVWVAAGQQAPSLIEIKGQTVRRSPSALVFLRAAPGVARDRIQEAVRGALSKESPFQTVQLGPATDVLYFGAIHSVSWAVIAFASLVFLAACANLGNMTYARGTQRTAEIAVRMSLGATRGDIFRMFVAEAAAVAATASALGLAASFAALGKFGAVFPALRFDRYTRFTFDLSPNYRMFLFAAALGALATLTVGFATAWRLSRQSIARIVAGAGTGVVFGTRGQRTRTTLVAVQVTAALLCLLVAGLFIENTSKALDRRLQYDTTPLVSARVRASAREYSESGTRAVFDQVVAAAHELPGVDAVAVADGIPGATSVGPRYGMSGLVADDPGRVASGLLHRYDVYSIHASPGFLDTVGIRLTRGRDLIPADAEDALVALISESAASALWLGQDPLGKHLKCCGYRASFTAVGVFADPVDSNDRSPLTRLSNFVILPIFQMAGMDPVVLVRSKSPVAQIDALRGAIAGVDPDLPVFEVSTVDDILLNGVAGQRAIRWLFTALGALALGIAVLGIYGVVTYFVSQRTREFGVRLALGATPRNVLKLVLDYTIHVMLVGLLPAVFIASMSTRLLEHNLMNLMPNSIAAWVQTPIMMLVTGVLAGLVPARRAARVDPNVALREL